MLPLEGIARDLIKIAKYPYAKRIEGVKQGFREFQSARRIIQGYEAMHMIRKGQGRWVRGSDVRRQIQFIEKLFELGA